MRNDYAGEPLTVRAIVRSVLHFMLRRSVPAEPNHGKYIYITASRQVEF